MPTFYDIYFTQFKAYEIHTSSTLQVADWARTAFFYYGGEAQYTYGGGGLSGDRPFMPSNIGPIGKAFEFLD